MSVNGCGAGWCSRFAKRSEVERCQSEAPPSWNGLCVFQDGNPLPSEESEVELGCCPDGCSISPAEFIRWNYLCPKK